MNIILYLSLLVFKPKFAGEGFTKAFEEGIELTPVKAYNGSLETQFFPFLDLIEAS